MATTERRNQDEELTRGTRGKLKDHIVEQVVHLVGKPAFLGGPHQCIGQEFVVLDAVVAIARVVHSFSLTLPPGAVVGPEPVLMIRPRGRMDMTVEPL